MFRLILSLFVIGYFCNNMSAQPYLRSHLKNNSNPVTFKEIQQSFDTWASAQELSQTKGWKWFKRWEQHYAERLNPDGSLPDPAIFYQEAINYNNLQQNQTSSSTNWLPMGPDYLPPSPNPGSGHGMARINCVAFHPSNSNIFWVGVAQGGVWKTSNGGQSWTPLDNGLPILRVSDIAVDPNNPDVLYVCLGDYEYNGVALSLDNRKRHTHYGIGVYKTTNGGLSWAPTGHVLNQTSLDYSLLRKLIINPNNSNHLVIGGFEGIWKSMDAGATWTQTQNTVIVSDMEQDPVNPNILYAATSFIFTLQTGTAGVLKSTDFGSTWTLLNTSIPTTNTVGRINIAIAPTDPNYIYALTCDGDGGFYGLYRSTNAGLSWTLQSTGTPTNILAWFEGDGEIGGQGWYDLCLLVDRSNKDRIYTGGVNIWGSDDGGVNWKAVSFWTNDYGQSVHADHHQFQYNPLDNKFYTCNDGGIMRTDSLIFIDWVDVYAGTPWPTVWENLSSGMQVTSFYRLGLNNGRILAGAQDNSTFYFDGTSWTNVIGGDGMECFFHPSDPNIFWGSWQYGGLARTDDGGSTFTYYLGDDITTNYGEEGEWTTPWLYSPLTDAVYAAYGNLWKSIDLGTTWSPISNMPLMNGASFPAQASALKQCSQNPNVIYMAKRIHYAYNSNAQVWVTQNEGTSWTNITTGLPDSLYFTSLAVDDDNPAIAWLTCSGFSTGQKVYQTTNSGATWTNISNNLPNLPVNSIVLDELSNDHTVYIATDLGVYFRNDNNPVWQLHGLGLPNVITSELEIDYTNQDLYVATFGRGIWKTDLAVISNTTALPLSASNMTVSPTPNDGQFVIQLETERDFDATLNIVDIMGRNLYTENLTITKGKNNKNLDLNLEEGVYFVQIVCGKDSKVIRTLVR